MPVIINKVGEHRNQDAIELLVRYMLGSKFYWRYGSRGLIADSQENIIQGFSYTKQMYDKTDGKQVNHFILGTEDEGISVAQLYYIAEVAADYFFSQGYQCFYVIHSGSEDSPNYHHIHFAVNTINYMTGLRLYETYMVVTEIKNYMKAEYPEYSWHAINDDSLSWDL